MPTIYSYPRRGAVASRRPWRRRAQDIANALRKNLCWGLGWALVFATGFSLWVALLSIARGSVDWPEYGMTTWSIISGYYFAALLAGLAVGLLRPLLRRRLGTFFVGWIAGTIAYGAVGFTMGAHREVPWWIAAVLGLPMGGVALVLRDDERLSKRAKTRPGFVLGVIAIGGLLALFMLAAGWW